MVNKKISWFIIPFFIALATLFPPFLIRGYRKWAFLFNPPVSVSEKYYIKVAVGEIDWSILIAEYILAITIGIIIGYIWEVKYNKK